MTPLESGARATVHYIHAIPLGLAVGFTVNRGLTSKAYAINLRSSQKGILRGRLIMSAQTETIEITGLPEGTREAIKELSRSKGKSAEDYLRTLIEAEILSELTFAEILAPIREAFRRSGMTEEQLDALFEEARQKVHQGKQTNKE